MTTPKAHGKRIATVAGAAVIAVAGGGVGAALYATTRTARRRR